MYLAQGPPDVHHVEVAMALAVIIVAAFWRTVLRIALAALATVVIVAVVYGVATFMNAAHG